MYDIISMTPWMSIIELQPIVFNIILLTFVPVKFLQITIKQYMNVMNTGLAKCHWLVLVAILIC